MTVLLAREVARRVTHEVRDPAPVATERGQQHRRIKVTTVVPAQPGDAVIANRVAQRMQDALAPVAAAALAAALPRRKDKVVVGAKL